MAFPGGSDGKESACNAGIRVWPLGWEGPLEKGMATYSVILPWKIPYNYFSVCFLKTRTVSYRELYSILCNGLYGKRINKKARYVCVCVCVCVCVYIYIYTQLIHFAVHEKLTQHCKSTILWEKIKRTASYLTAYNYHCRDHPNNEPTWKNGATEE